jgi:hypothetical protein
MASLDYYENNRRALALIRAWLIKTGALCGQKHPTKFIANWTAAKTEPEIMAWWRANRGMAERDHARGLRPARWYFQEFIALLSTHNPEEGSLQQVLQTEFWDFVHDHRIAQKLQKIEEEARQKKRDEEQRIAKEHEAEIQELQDKYVSLQRKANDAREFLKQRCQETHNQHMFFGKF